MQALKAHTQRFVKYFFVGGSAAVLNWAIFFCATKIFAIHYILAGIVAFFLATLWNFILARKFIFRASRHSIAKESAIIYLVSLIGLVIDIITLFVCVEIFALDSMLGKILASGVAFGFNFGIRNFVVYKEQK